MEFILGLAIGIIIVIVVLVIVATKYIDNIFKP